jgi:hypothetical protein
MEDLNDPLGDRVMKDVPMIARFPLTREELWHNSGKYNYISYEFPIAKANNRRVPNIDLLRNHLLREGLINKAELSELITGVIQILNKEPNVIRI